jgi:hypothetical protein
MIMKIEIIEIARREYDEAKEFYEREQPGLGTKFEEQIRHSLLRIEAPCSKLQGIFDPQGSITYSNRSLTPQQDFGELRRAATGNELAPGFSNILKHGRRSVKRSGGTSSINSLTRSSIPFRTMPSLFLLSRICIGSRTIG